MCALHKQQKAYNKCPRPPEGPKAHKLNPAQGHMHQVGTQYRTKQSGPRGPHDRYPYNDTAIYLLASSY